MVCGEVSGFGMNVDLLESCVELRGFVLRGNGSM